MAAVNLADFTRPDWIRPRLFGRDEATVIYELGGLLKEGGFPVDAGVVARTAHARELAGGTEMAEGISLPHARVPGLARLCFALGRSCEPIRWGRGRVTLVFLAAIPESDSLTYLQWIAAVARLSKDGRTLGQLRAAADELQIFAALEKVEGTLRQTSGLAPGRYDGPPAHARR